MHSRTRAIILGIIVSLVASISLTAQAQHSPPGGTQQNTQRWDPYESFSKLPPDFYIYPYNEDFYPYNDDLYPYYDNTYPGYYYYGYPYYYNYPHHPYHGHKGFESHEFHGGGRPMGPHGGGHGGGEHGGGHGGGGHGGGGHGRP